MLTILSMAALNGRCVDVSYINIRVIYCVVLEETDAIYSMVFGSRVNVDDFMARFA